MVFCKACFLLCFFFSMIICQLYLASEKQKKKYLILNIPYSQVDYKKERQKERIEQEKKRMKGKSKLILHKKAELMLRFSYPLLQLPMLGALESSMIYYFLRPSLYLCIAELFHCLLETTPDAFSLSGIHPMDHIRLILIIILEV